MLGLSQALQDELNNVFQLHALWLDLRGNFLLEAQSLGVILDPHELGGQAEHQDRQALALWAELEREAIDTDALRFTLPPFMSSFRGSRADHLPLNLGAPRPATPYPERFEMLFHAFLLNALEGWHRGGRRPATDTTIPPQPAGLTLAQTFREKLKGLIGRKQVDVSPPSLKGVHYGEPQP